MSPELAGGFFTTSTIWEDPCVFTYTNLIQIAILTGMHHYLTLGVHNFNFKVRKYIECGFNKFPKHPVMKLQR